MRRGSQVSRHYVAQSPQEFRPTYLPGCVLWLRADLGITLGATLKATGTTPPAATISGTPNGLYGLHIEIDNAGGARGTATFKWSLDNGATYQATGVLTAATTVLGSTGITVTWPVGTYNADNKYDATISQWNDQSGAGNHVSQATATKQPQLRIAATVGKPGVQFDGAATIMINTTFSHAQPNTVIVVAKSASQNGRFLIDGKNGGTGRNVLEGDSAANIGIYAGTTVPGACNMTIYCVVSAEFNGASSFARRNGSQFAAGDVGAQSMDGLSVGAHNQELGGTFWDDNILEIILWNRAISTFELNRAERSVGARYAVNVS